MSAILHDGHNLILGTLVTFPIVTVPQFFNNYSILPIHVHYRFPQLLKPSPFQ